MYSFTVKELLVATEGKLLCGNMSDIVTDISTDSRQVSGKSLFIPIIGDVYDGHNFMESAYEVGCRTFIIDKNHIFDKKDINLIQVDETLKAFGDIAKYYREQFNIPVIGITGSVGKTTTKDMTTSVLSQKYNTLSNYENYNNEIGVPKTLLRLEKSHEIAVIEMGAEKKGDISYLVNMVKPSLSVITIIGMAHLEYYENQRGIFLSKMEIANGFDKNNTLIVNGDNEFLKELRSDSHVYKLITYGFNDYNDLYCKSYEINDSIISFTCIYNNQSYDFSIPNPAKHNIYNAMAAICVGLIMNVDMSKIKEGLFSYNASHNRMEIFNNGKVTVINDSYNASVDAMIGVIDVLSNYKTRKVALLGDMCEIGSAAVSEHRKIGHLIKEKEIDVLITVGENAKYINEGASEVGFSSENSYHFETNDDLLKEIDKILKQDDTVLIKASHAIKLYDVANYLRDK